jgi:hypothetical protein
MISALTDWYIVPWSEEVAKHLRTQNCRSHDYLHEGEEDG